MELLLIAAIVVGLWGAHVSGNKVADSIEAMSHPDEVEPPSMPGVGVTLALVFVLGVVFIAFTV